MATTDDIDEFSNSKEYIWGCQLTKASPTSCWQLESEDERDYLSHTLLLKQALVGVDCLEGETNIVEVTTFDANKETLKIPIASLVAGRQNMALLDLCFGPDNPATFTLIQGSGPVCIIGQESIDMPEEEADVSQDEEDEELVEEEAEQEAPEKHVATKRKAKKPATNGRTKKGRRDVTVESDEEESSGQEEESASDEEMSEEDSEEEVKTKKHKKDKKVNDKTAKAPGKKSQEVASAKNVKKAVKKTKK